MKKIFLLTAILFAVIAVISANTGSGMATRVLVIGGILYGIHY